MQEPMPPLGLWSTTCLVIANMIGAGVFTTSGFALQDLGSPTRVLWAWALGGFIAWCGAIGYGRLARTLTDSGGEYLYLSRMIHPALGFVAGWISLLAGFTGAIALAATAFEIYLVPDALRPAWLPQNLVAVFLILVLGILHASDVRLGTLSQNVIVLLKITLIFAFIGLALFALARSGRLTPTAPPSKAFSVPDFAACLIWISLAYSGFNAAVYVAGEVRDAQRTVPRALLWGTALVTALYLTLNSVFVLGVPFEMAAGKPDIAAVAAKHIGGTALANCLRGAIALALASSVSSMLQAGPRVLAKMADDGVLPSILKATGKAPRWATCTQVFLACIVVTFTNLQQQLSYLGFTLSLSAACTVSSLFLTPQRRRLPGAAWQLIAAAIYVVGTVGIAIMAATRRPTEVAAFVITIVTGLIVYATIRRVSPAKR